MTILVRYKHIKIVYPDGRKLCYTLKHQSDGALGPFLFTSAIWKKVSDVPDSDETITLPWDSE